MHEALLMSIPNIYFHGEITIEMRKYQYLELQACSIFLYILSKNRI